MDCSLIEPLLVAYAFGASEPDDAERIELHLVDCKACLRAFLSLKRQLERRDGEERPSPAARARLFAAVQQRYGARGSRPAGRGLRGVLRRPMPLYQTLIAAALALGLAVLWPELTSSVRSQRVSSGERVDTSRLRPQNLDVY